MKTKMFTTLFALFQAAIRAAVQGLAIAILCTGVVAASVTEGAVTTDQMALQVALPTGNYTASTTLAPAAGSGAEVTVEPAFEGMGGFDNARLAAVITGSGGVLTVTLTGFTGNELPEGELLGTVFVTEGGNVRAFEVRVDGGITVLDEIDM